MFKIAVRNVRMIEHADIVGPGIHLICAKNGRGKSSLLETTALVLSGLKVPPGFAQKDAALLVKDGAKEGGIQITSDGGTVTTTWPKCERESTGNPPRASMIAAGVCQYSDLSAPERAELLADRLKSLPTKDDLKGVLQDIVMPVGMSFDDDLLKPLWEAIQKSGWDVAWKNAKTRGASLKGKWGEVTGEDWGEKKGGDWSPENYDSALVNLSEEDLQRRVDEATNAHNRAIGTAAVSASDVERWKDQAASIADYTTTLETAKAAEDQARTSLEQLQGALASLPPADEDEPSQACPHCNAAIALHAMKGGGYLLAKARVAAGSTDERKKRREDLQAAEVKVTHAKRTLETAQAAVLAGERSLAEANRASSMLKTATVAAGATAQDKEKAADNVQAVKDQNAAVAAKKRADAYHLHILANQRIVGELAIEGLRKTVMVRTLDLFNERQLAEISEACGWPRVSLDANLNLLYGSKQHFLAKSFKLRCNITFQIAMALMEHAPFICIDEVDLLDDEGRNGLIGGLAHLNLPAILGCTVSSPAKVPNLEKAGLGQSWWVENMRVTKAVTS